MYTGQFWFMIQSYHFLELLSRAKAMEKSIYDRIKDWREWVTKIEARIETPPGKSKPPLKVEDEDVRDNTEVQ